MKNLWRTETTPEQKQAVRSALEAQELSRLTNHTPETALAWITNLCNELQKRGIDYKEITFTAAAIAIEKQERRRAKRKAAEEAASDGT